MSMQIQTRWKMLLHGAAIGLCVAEACAQSNTASDLQNAAALLAKTQLASELKVDIAGIETLSYDPETWSDSGLGCSKPGTMAAQVISDGYAVVLKTEHGNYRVHVSGANAVVCGLATQWQSGTVGRGGQPYREPGVPLRNLNEMIDKARTDLAGKLGVFEKDVRMMTFAPKQWPDSSLGCSAQGEKVSQQRQRGYVIALRKGERTYTYHTDMTTVRACPAIELE
ncbi:MAG TPA: hypothetical protein VK629_05055 [Steroidobacteraceae bacterium]|nr:hypothetical protein [Steroidobacteraceae bacterium]